MDTFTTYGGPANLLETANSIGLPLYARQHLDEKGRWIDLMTEVVVPISSVCPCSKEISDFGAHNQRGEVTYSVRAREPIWIEDLIRLVETCASSELYSLLKRPDEKHVTEKAYENPKFVEDIVRDLAIAMESEDRIEWYAINSENFESIHSHNAYAQITRDKRG